MKRQIFRIICIAISIIACLIVCFALGIHVLDKLENDKTSNIEISQESIENEAEQNDETNENKTSYPQDIIINNDDENSKRNSFEGVIAKIDGKEIIVENRSHLVDYTIYEADYKWHREHEVIIDGKVYVTAGYMLQLDNVPIKDSNGKKIESRDLKVGDIVNVFTKDMKYTINIIFEPLTSKNITLIEKI